MNDEILELIVKSRNYDKMTHFGSHPMPGEYVITGPQAGGFKGWNNYVGYVVQVRKKAGAFGSDMILLRPLTAHSHAMKTNHFIWWMILGWKS